MKRNDKAGKLSPKIGDGTKFYHHSQITQNPKAMDESRIENIFSAAEMGSIFSWEDVNKVHRIRNGIYQRNGRLISLLTDFGRINPCYPDMHGETKDLIFYTGNGRRGDQRLDTQNRAMLDAIAVEIHIPLFNKLAPGKWEFLGYWQVVDGEFVFDEKQSRMVWKFTLKKGN